MLRSIAGGCTLSVRVQRDTKHGAKRDAISGTEGDALKISVTAAPSEGQANAEVIAFLARRLGVPRPSIDVLSGSTGRMKTLRIRGITAAEAEARLLNDLA